MPEIPLLEVPQESVNGKPRNNTHLLAPSLRCGYSGSCVSLQGNLNETSPTWIHDDQIMNGNPPVTICGCDSKGTNAQSIGKHHGISMSVGILTLNETTT